MFTERSRSSLDAQNEVPMIPNYKTGDPRASSHAPCSTPPPAPGVGVWRLVGPSRRVPTIAVAWSWIAIWLVCFSFGCQGSPAAKSSSAAVDPLESPSPAANEFICQGVEGTEAGAAPGLPRCPAEKAVTNAHCQAAGLLHYFSADLCIERCLPPDQLKGNECCTLVDAVGKCCRTELDEQGACLPVDPNPPSSPPVRCPEGRVYTCSATACRCR